MPITDFIYFSYLPLLAVLVSLVAVPLILASSRKPNFREFWSLAAALGKFLCVFSLLPGILAGKIASISLWEIFPGIRISLHADALGTFFALIASGLWVVTSLYSIGYMRRNQEKKQTRYYACFALCLSATIGIAFAANLLTFVLFYEILTISTYPLVIHKETKEAIQAGRKYLAYTLSAGVLLIAAAALTYHWTGTLEFETGGLLSHHSLPASLIRILFGLFFTGVGVKAGIMPLHSWLPSAMVAPTPVSALLHAVAVVKAGVFGVIRIIGFVFGPKLMTAYGLNTILAAAAGVTIIVASLIALTQDDLKRRLAYSTVGHLSYIVLGAAIGFPAGLTGSILHIAAHATMKITLFFCAGAIYVHLHKTKVSQLDGVGRAMPWTMAAFAVGAAGLSGIPPVNGFLSKWFLLSGTLQSGQPIFFAILIVSGLLNIAYLFPIVYRSFFRRSEEHDSYNEAPALLRAPLLITALFSVIWGLFPDLFFRFFTLAASAAQRFFPWVES